MTIAACYVSPEGVVLGTDSTTTFPSVSGNHCFNYTQKLFKVGTGSTLGLATWGIGSLGEVSYRSLVAQLADDIANTHVASVGEVASRWTALVWSVYCDVFDVTRQRVRELKSKSARTQDEELELLNAQFHSSAGFCIGGHIAVDRRPEAYETNVSPDLELPPAPVRLPMGSPRFWGWSNLIGRLTNGMDDYLFGEILQSGKWTGSVDDLRNLVANYKLAPPGVLPIREAIDWVHASIYTTIKGIKFSRFDPVCGGPIEIAVITTDRRFRWVRHKGLDAAMS